MPQWRGVTMAAPPPSQRRWRGKTTTPSCRMGGRECRRHGVVWVRSVGRPWGCHGPAVQGKAGLGLGLRRTDGGRPQLPLTGHTGLRSCAAMGTKSIQGIHTGATGDPAGLGRAGLRSGLNRGVAGAHGAAQGGRQAIGPRPVAEPRGHGGGGGGISKPPFAQVRVGVSEPTGDGRCPVGHCGGHYNGLGG